MVRLRSLVPALVVAFCAGCTSANNTPPAPTPTVSNFTCKSDGFVSVQGSQFILNGEPFRFIGTNAYYLAALNSDKDINDTIQDIVAHNITVIRTWAFNDVSTIPVNGTWFQLIQNGTTTINTGPNGLQKLDKVIQAADAAGVKIIFSLTNNWNPLPTLDNITESNNTAALTRRDFTFGTNNTLPRNFLSNDYGGMDAYVREFGVSREHSEFFTNDTIINIFKNYTNQIVQRYANCSAVFAWELANDARCNSTLTTSALCNSLNVTTWHDDVGSHVAEVDPNHLVSSGVQGFMCMDCPKLHPLAPPPPPPAPSPVPGPASVRRKKRTVQPITKERLVREFTDRLKRNRRKAVKEGISIRGRWVASKTARQASPLLGVAFDGSTGVDAQDILNSPNIGFGTFQLFPDQDNYGPVDPNLTPFENALQTGDTWIRMQGQLGQLVGKPMILSAFGIVSQNNTASFIPFNQSVTPSVEETTPSANGIGVQAVNATDTQQVQAYSQWITTAAQSGISGAIQFQWGQGNLTAQDGTTITPNDDTSAVSPNDDTSGVSPNDGYRSAPTGSDGVAGVLSSLASFFSTAT